MGVVYVPGALQEKLEPIWTASHTYNYKDKGGYNTR